MPITHRAYIISHYIFQRDHFRNRTCVHASGILLKHFPRCIYIYVYSFVLFLHPLLKGLGTSRPHRQFAASLSQVFPLAYVYRPIFPSIHGHVTLSLNGQVLQASARPCLSTTRTRKGSHVTPSLSDHVSRSFGMPVPLYHTYLRVVTPPEVVNQFTGHESLGLSPVPEGHRCIGLEHVFSALVTYISTVARTTIHGERRVHSPLFREYSRFVSNSHYTAVVIPHTDPLTRSSNIPTVPRLLAHISMITKHLSHERVRLALTFPRPCSHRSILSGFLSSTISGHHR